MTENKKQVYILSLEASDIYSHMTRNTSINYEYCGMIPYSLELIKLRKEGLRTKYIKSRDKEISNDIINVKFKQKVKSGNELKSILNKKKEESSLNSDYVKNINSFISLIGDEGDENWEEVGVEELRRRLYTNGFKIKYKDKKSGDIRIVEYVVYKRSSSKSRTGQCLFIKKSLYNKMIKWSRMNLPFRKNMEIDLAGLLAYESLVGSSLENTIKINPKNILIVSDVNSKFKQVCNVVRKGGNGYLDSFTEDVEVSNSLFDGESLLDEMYFEDGIGMKLLRNHMFKSASFNCKLQKFLKDNCPHDVKFEDWQIKNMYNELMYAKDAHMVITPSSLKALKFSSILGTEKEMWNYWKNVVEKDGNLFGVCKHDKKSKFGEDENGNILQQTSYQMINCLPMTMSDVEGLTETERLYIERLKNDDNFFIEKVRENSNLINSNEMLTELYRINNEIIHTKLFRDFRKSFIKNHVNHSKKGKIKLKGDYCVMLGNPIEFLYHSIGKLNLKTPTLKDNEVYTKLFEFDKEYIGFRNPNTSPSNVLLVMNKQIKEIEDYFNLSKNIVCVNAIDFPLQDILSGCDYDSDTVLLFDNPKMLELGKKCFGKYYVCINEVESQKKDYRLNKDDMFDIDNQLSTSQKNIGKVVNLGQFCMSVYWHLLNNGQSGKHVDDLLKKVDVMTVLSGIAIDMAKKFYEIDIDKEINNVAKNEELKKKTKKPMFWKYVSQSKTIGKRVEKYDCPMDNMIESIDSLNKADYKKDIALLVFLEDFNISNSDRKQKEKISNIIETMQSDIIKINISSVDNEEKYNLIEDNLNDCLKKLSKYKIKQETMLDILKKIEQNDSNKIKLRLMNVLYNSQKAVFLSVFKPKSPQS